MILIKKYFYGIGLIILAAFSIGSVIPHVYADDTCIDCHKDIKTIAQDIKLIRYYMYWKDSTHDLAGVKCTDCHGGSPAETDKDAAHNVHFSSFLAVDKKSSKLITDICGKCHKDVLKNFTESKHYKKLLGMENAPNCITCHGSMNTEIFDVYGIAKGCEGCHNDETKNDPEIGEVAMRVLNNINILHVYRNWLSSHNIFNKQKRDRMLIQYQDIILSWHTFNFSKIEERLQQPMEKARMLVRDEKQYWTRQKKSIEKNDQP